MAGPSHMLPGNVYNFGHRVGCGTAAPVDAVRAAIAHLGLGEAAGIAA